MTTKHEELQLSNKQIVNITVTPELFEEKPWYRRLDDDTKGFVYEQGVTLVSAMHNYGRSRLQMAEVMYHVNKRLAPQNLFSKFCLAFNLPWRTMARLVTEYENAVRTLPRPVLEGAMARNMNMLGEKKTEPVGIYSAAVRKLPPPKHIKSPEQVGSYLDEVQATYKQMRSKPSRKRADADDEEQDPQVLLKSAVKFLVLCRKHLPKGARTQMNWLDTFFGMTMAAFGVSSGKRFEPQAIPEDFKRGRGRPPLEESPVTTAA